MVDAESGWNPNAVGDSGHAIGLLQLHDAGLGRGMTRDERLDPETNLRRGIDYHMRYRREPRWTGTPDEIPASITCHNAGQGAVNAAYDRGGTYRDVVHHRNADGSVVTVAEMYTDKILARAERYR